MSLPSIIGEEKGEKYTIEILFGSMKSLIFYNAVSRTLSINSEANHVDAGTYYLTIKLINN